MLLIASETLRSNPVIKAVVREMSLTPSFYGSVETFGQMIRGQSRRIVLLPESDINPETVGLLTNPRGRAPLGLLLAADRVSLRDVADEELIERLANYENVEWLGHNFTFDRLSGCVRRSRRRLLRLSREELNNAMENGEIVLRYQPKVERGPENEWLTREAEALIRWQHPKHGLIGPLEFLPEAEAFDMMGALGEFVLREAAKQQVKWRDQGIQFNACINLASSQLNRSDLAARYRDIVVGAGLSPGGFTFEVVEQDLSDPAAPHLATIRSLRQFGFRICLDDFRVAASSLSTFEQLPFDEIKIHSSALRKAQEDAVSRSVLAAVTGLAHNLGMTVCAAGVEDQETFEFLKTINCDKMQGFLISEAVIPGIIRRVYSAKARDEDTAA